MNRQSAPSQAKHRILNNLVYTCRTVIRLIRNPIQTKPIHPHELIKIRICHFSLTIHIKRIRTQPISIPPESLLPIGIDVNLSRVQAPGRNHTCIDALSADSCLVVSTSTHQNTQRVNEQVSAPAGSSDSSLILVDNQLTIRRTHNQTDVLLQRVTQELAVESTVRIHSRAGAIVDAFSVLEGCGGCCDTLEQILELGFVVLNGDDVLAWVVQMIQNLRDYDFLTIGTAVRVITEELGIFHVGLITDMEGIWLKSFNLREFQHVNGVGKFRKSGLTQYLNSIHVVQVCVDVILRNPRSLLDETRVLGVEHFVEGLFLLRKHCKAGREAVVCTLVRIYQRISIRYDLGVLIDDGGGSITFCDDTVEFIIIAWPALFSSGRGWCDTTPVGDVSDVLLVVILRFFCQCRIDLLARDKVHQRIPQLA